LLNTAPELFKHIHGEESSPPPKPVYGGDSPRDKLMSSISGLGTSAKPSEVRRGTGRLSTSLGSDESAKSSPLLADRIKSPTPPKSNESFVRLTTSSPSSRVSETLEVSRSPEGYKTTTRSIIQRTIIPSSEERYIKDPDRPKYSDSIKYIDVKSPTRQGSGVFIEVRDWNSR
jgi:hypothetical protein